MSLSSERNGENKMYQIIDSQTGLVVGVCKTLKGAISSVNKRDNQYGAARFYRQMIKG